MTMIPARPMVRNIVTGVRTSKGDIRLFLWRKPAVRGTTPAGTILFVHGSSMASQPTFDLQVPDRPDSSVMDWFAKRGFDTSNGLQ